MSPKLKTIFFCGDRSVYGMAHLEAVAEQFDLLALVVADDARWRKFRVALMGGEQAMPGATPLRRLRRRVRDLLCAPQRARAECGHQARLRAAGAPLVVVNDANDSALHERLRGLGAEIVLSAAYPQIFKKPLLELAPRGAVNFHPSLLPRCRGAHPHYWCLATGEERGGVSAHFMTERIDDGDLIAQRGFPLDGLYYAELYARIVAETPPLVAEVRAFFENPSSVAVPQDESKATYFRNDRDAHHRMDWQVMTARELHNRIRAGNAWSLYGGRRSVFTRAALAEECPACPARLPAGTVAAVDGRGIWITTKDGSFIVAESLEGRRRIEPFDVWAEKRGLKTGGRFD